MDIKIGEVIQSLRKNKGLTQEEVADAVGVSKASVSKWENGYTYPDITLLAPLARLLDTSINELLEFNSKLTEKEINGIVNKCSEEFLKGDYFSAFEYCESQLKKYPNVEELKLTIATLYWQHTILIADNEKECNRIIDHACKLYEQVSQSSNIDIKESSLACLTSLKMMNKDYDGALEWAKKLNQKSNETQNLMATIYRQKGEDESAKKLYQRLLLNNIQTSVMVLQSLSKISENEGNIREAEILLKTVKKLDDLFEAESNGGTVYFNLAHLYATNNDIDKAIEMLRKYTDAIKILVSTGYKSISSSIFFSTINIKDEESNSIKFAKQHIANAVKSTPAFDLLQENEDFKKIIEELSNL